MTFNLAALAQDANTYLVRQGDTLVSILREFGMKPIYSKHGSLNRVIKLNSELVNFRGNQITPGQIITLSKVDTCVPIRYIASNEEKSQPIIPLPQSQAKPEEKSYSEFTIAFDKKTTSIKGLASDGTSGKINSSDSQGYKLEWSPKLGENFWLSFGLTNQNYTFNEANNRTLSGRKQSLNGLYLNSHYRWTANFSTEFLLGQSDQIFYRATSLSEIKIEKQSVSYTQLSLRYDFLKRDSILYAFKLDGRMHLPSQSDYYRSKLGFGHTASFVAEHKINAFTLVGQAYYAQDNFPVKGIEYKRNDVGVILGLRYSLGN
jgi:hypothetical protein